MNASRHAWISLLVVGSVIAEEPLPAPDKAGPKGERHGKGRDWMAGMWKKADSDKDGSISMAEFAAMERPGRLPEEKRAELFQRLDKNGDGRIGPDEMPKAPHGGMPPLNQVDLNKDGRIDFEEFQKLGFVARLPEDRRRGLFERMDKDQDGALTAKDRLRGKRDGRGDGRRDGKGGRGPNPLELIRSLDRNGDGALSFAEFRQAEFLRDKGEDEQEERFEEMDRNDDLKLDASDFPPPGEHKREPREPDKA